MARAMTNDVYEKGLDELRRLKEKTRLEEEAKVWADFKLRMRAKRMEELQKFEPEWLTNTALPTLRLNNVPRRGGGSRRLVVAIGGEICGWVFNDISSLILDSGILESPEAKL